MTETCIFKYAIVLKVLALLHAEMLVDLPLGQLVTTYFLDPGCNGWSLPPRNCQSVHLWGVEAISSFQPEDADSREQTVLERNYCLWESCWETLWAAGKPLLLYRDPEREVSSWTGTCCYCYSICLAIACYSHPLERAFFTSFWPANSVWRSGLHQRPKLCCSTP